MTDQQLKTVSDNARKRADVVVPEKIGNTTNLPWYERTPAAIERAKQREAYLVEAYQRDEESAREERMQAAELPLRHTRRTENLDRSGPWRDAYERILGRIGSGFLVALTGGRGAGKTQMAVELALQTIGQGRSALYTTVLEMFFAARAGFKDGNTELDGLRRFLSPSFLVIDEVCNRGDTEFEDRMLMWLIDRRYRDMQDTILCANEIDDGTDKSPLRKSLGRSIVSRMAETGEVVHCEWPSFRGETS